MEDQQAISPPAPPRRRFIWRLLAVTACLPVIAVLIWYLCAIFLPGPYYNMDSQEVFASHLLVLQEKRNLVNIQSSDPRAVQSWFQSRLDFAPPVRDLSADGFQLEGGRLDYMHDRPVAAVVYRRDSHVIDLFIWPGENHEYGFERAGLYLIPWNQSDLTFWAISDLNSADMAQFADLFKASQH